MDEKKWFGVMVRGFGMAAALYSVYNGLSLVVYWLEQRGTTPSFLLGGVIPFDKAIIVYAAVFAALSIYLLRGAPGLEKFCFPTAVSDFNEDGAVN